MFGLTVSLAPRGKKGKMGRMGPLQRATADRFPASEAEDLLERSMDLLERSEAEQRFPWFRSSRGGAAGPSASPPSSVGPVLGVPKGNEERTHPAPPSLVRKPGHCGESGFSGLRPVLFP